MHEEVLGHYIRSTTHQERVPDTEEPHSTGPLLFIRALDEQNMFRSSSRADNGLVSTMSTGPPPHPLLLELSSLKASLEHYQVHGSFLCDYSLKRNSWRARFSSSTPPTLRPSIHSGKRLNYQT